MVISACAIVIVVVVCAIALIASWLDELGNSGGGLCADRSSWGLRRIRRIRDLLVCGLFGGGGRSGWPVRVLIQRQV